MSMRMKSGSSLLTALLLSAFLLQGCNDAEPAMSAYDSHDGVTLKQSTEQLLGSPSRQVLSRQGTVMLRIGATEQSIEAQGFIDIDQSRSKTVSARFGGRIETLYVRYNMQLVQRGEKIMELYSPDLRTIQEEHLFIIKSGAEQSLVDVSRERLRLLGITGTQVDQLERNGQVATAVSLYSPSTGFVYFNALDASDANISDASSTKSGMDMIQSKTRGQAYQTSAAQIREGAYVNAGQLLFSVNDLQQVWALVYVPHEHLASIQENESVEIVAETNPSKIMHGKISLIEKTFEESSQRFVRIRIALPNPDKDIKVNSFVSAQFDVRNSRSMQVPASAVYKTGLNTYVWVKTDTTASGVGVFHLRKVLTGANSNGMTSIKSGITPNEEIAKQAGFMTDSETYLNEE